MELGFILPVEGVDAAALARWLTGEQKLGDLQPEIRPWRLQVEGLLLAWVLGRFRSSAPIRNS